MIDKKYLIERCKFEGYNIFFKKLKGDLKDNVYSDNYILSILNHINNKDKKQNIIFSLNESKLDLLEPNKNKIVFPFEDVFIEYVLTEENKNFFVISPGFFLFILEDIIFCVLQLEIFNKGRNGLVFDKSNVIILNTSKEKLFGLIDNPRRMIEEKDNPHNLINNSFFNDRINNIIRKFLTAIRKKEYTTYKKWTPSGFETKEIVYAHTRASHKRHFWEDSGKYNIPKLSKEEILERGYGIDELVFRNGELRRDVPYTIIGQVEVGNDKKQKEDNRRINLLKGKVLRQEGKLGNIIREIYPEETIRRHDRKKLKGLELDFFLPGLSLAFEYDGEQHFDRKLCEEVFKSDFNELQKRDRKKNSLCRNKNIKLIRIKFDEPLTKKHILKKINN